MPTYWFIFQKNNLIFQGTQLVNTDSIKLFFNELKYRHFLAIHQGQNIYCAEIPADFSLSPNMTAIPLRQALEMLGQEWYTLATKAFAIINWDRNHQYCGQCGSPTQSKENRFERVCSSCGLIFYPRISPSMIVLIHREDEILMARSPHFKKGSYGLIAGFVEAGETVEETVHREVTEEVGIKIKNLRYFSSQSWPFPDSLMFAFLAEYDSGILIINHEEIEEAGWYHYDHLPGRPASSLSIANKLIEHYIAQRRKDLDKK